MKQFGKLKACLQLKGLCWVCRHPLLTQIKKRIGHFSKDTLGTGRKMNTSKPSKCGMVWSRGAF